MKRYVRALSFVLLMSGASVFLTGCDVASIGALIQQIGGIFSQIGSLFPGNSSEAPSEPNPEAPPSLGAPPSPQTPEGRGRNDQGSEPRGTTGEGQRREQASPKDDQAPEAQEIDIDKVIQEQEKQDKDLEENPPVPTEVKLK